MRLDHLTLFIQETLHRLFFNQPIRFVDFPESLEEIIQESHDLWHVSDMAPELYKWERHQVLQILFDSLCEEDELLNFE